MANARRRFLDLAGWIWRDLALLCFVVKLQWQGQWREQSWGSSFSLNKAPLFSLLGLPELALLHGVRWLPMSFSVKPLRWRCGGQGCTGAASFNKGILL
jgi:hypothetical protein